jgi:hypothetical protein
LHAGIQPAQPEFVVFRKIAGGVSSMLLQQVTPEHDAGMHHRRLDESSQGNVRRREQRIGPGDMNLIARLLRWVAAMPHAAGDQPNLRMALEELQLPLKPLRSHPVVRVHPRDDRAASRGAPALQRLGNAESSRRQDANPRVGAGGGLQNPPGVIV